MILDCGHPEDAGLPPPCSKRTGATRPSRLEFVLLDGRKVCHACADRRIPGLWAHRPARVLHDRVRTDAQGRRSAYECCAVADRKTMTRRGIARTCRSTSQRVLTNCSARSSSPCTTSTRHGHNWGGVRVDVWFNGPGRVRVARVSHRTEHNHRALPENARSASNAPPPERRAHGLGLRMEHPQGTDRAQHPRLGVRRRDAVLLPRPHLRGQRPVDGVGTPEERPSASKPGSAAP